MFRVAYRHPHLAAVRRKSFKSIRNRSGGVRRHSAISREAGRSSYSASKPCARSFLMIFVRFRGIPVDVANQVVPAKRPTSISRFVVRAECRPPRCLTRPAANSRVQSNPARNHRVKPSGQAAHPSSSPCAARATRHGLPRTAVRCLTSARCRVCPCALLIVPLCASGCPGCLLLVGHRTAVRGRPWRVARAAHGDELG